MLSRNLRRFVILCIALVSLTACKEVLYSNLTEKDANAMLAHLDAAGIAASRSADKDGIYAISVERADLAGAITVLENEGLPRKSYQSIGTIFDAEGIVGTPFEERARFIYAMNEELSRTLAGIHGVTMARVHIMVPEAGRFDDGSDPSRASVIIHYEAGFAAQQNVPTIKTLVSHAVENLEYDNVAVALFAAETLQVTLPERDAGSMADLTRSFVLDLSGVPNAWLIVVGGVAAVMLLVLGLLRAALRLTVRG